jgi:uncharacterized short protein YbdD (DUF466 family)
VRLRSELTAAPACTEATSSASSGGRLAECLACARGVARQWRAGWRKAIGAPDYAAYLAHHAARHPGVAPLSERDYVAMFIEHRFNGGGMRCC